MVDLLYFIIVLVAHIHIHVPSQIETVGVASTTAATADLTSTITLHSNIGCSDQAHCLQ